MPAGKAEVTSTEGLRALFAGKHDELVKIVQDTSKATEPEILEVGRIIDLVVREARADAAKLQSLLDSDATGFATITNGLLEQSDLLESYVTSFTRCLNEILDIVGKSINLASQIEKSARYFEDIVQVAVSLGFFARIEVARIAADDVDLISFSNEFRTLTVDLRRGSVSVGNIANSVLRSFHSIFESASKLRKICADVTPELRRQVDLVRLTAESVKTSLSVIRQRTESHIEQSLAMAQQILSELQFYEPLIQELQSLDGIMAQLRTAVAVGDPGDRQPVTPIAFAQRLGMTQGNLKAIEDSDEQSAAGEVMLF
jgi:hypothetical protein